jgi:hypothetical protein
LNKYYYNLKMVHVIFDTSTVGYDDFIQTGGGVLSTEPNDSGGFNYFRGSPPFQRGYGIQGGAGVGDVFRGIWRFFLPILSKAGTAISAEALNTGQRILDKIKEGEPLKSSVLSEGKKGIDTVLDQGGFPKQFGSGFPRKRRATRRKPALIPNHQTIIGSTITKPLAHSKKRLRSDAFGLY